MVEALVIENVRPDALRRAVAVWGVVPVSQLAAADDAGAPAWEAVDNDPQFALLPGVGPLPAGWYRLQARFAELAGEISAPCLYPDYGSGISEETRIPVSYVHHARRLDCLVRFSADVQSLRFDPTTTVAEFSLGELDAVALQPAEALWMLLRTVMASLRDADPIAAKALADAVRAYRQDGDVNGALAWLWPRYVALGQSEAHAYGTWLLRAERALTALLPPSLPTASPPKVPRFSLLLQGWGSVDDSLACIGTLFRQREGDFELLLSQDHASTLVPDLTAGGTMPLDPRVRVVADAGATGLGALLEVARGEFVMVVSGADRLHECALAVFGQAIAGSPQAALLYCDEDRIDMHGRRHLPYFKPAWDPDLFLNHDFLGRSVAIRRTVLAGVVLADLDPQAPLFDLCLRVVEGLPPGGVVHVPHVLRHHSDLPGRVSAPFALDGDGPDARERVVAGHLRRLGNGACATTLPDGRLRVVYPLPTRLAVDIVVPTRDRIDLLSTCIASLLRVTDHQDYLVTIIDNGSELSESQAYFKWIARDRRVRVLRYDQLFNYSAINNFAVRHCQGDVVVLLNNDIEVIEGSWLREMASLAVRPEIGAVGARLYYPDGTIQHAGVVLGVGGVAAHAYAHAARDDEGQYGRARLVQAYSAVTAACLAVRRSIYDEVDGLDESIAVAFNDVDFCLRIAEHGYRNVWTPHAELYHHESASRGMEDDPVKQARFASEVQAMLKRWGPLLSADPAYSPNLSLVGPAFQIDPSRRAFAVVRQPIIHDRPIFVR